MAFSTYVIGDHLHVNITGISVWATCTRTFDVPFSQIESVEVSRGTQLLPWWTMRAGLMNFKWHRFGRFWRHHKRIFARYANADRALVIISLKDGARFSQIILQPSDPESFANDLRKRAGV